MGISLNRKNEIRQKHPLFGQARIHVTHILDKFRGGTDDNENLVARTVSEHIAEHYEKAVNEEVWKIAEVQYRSAHILAVNATPEEIEEANRLLAQIPKRR